MSNPSWDNLEILGRRLNRLIKFSESMLKKTDKDDHDGKNRYITTIVSLTRNLLEIIKLHDSYEEINAYFSVIKQDELTIKKHSMREQKKNIQRDKQEIQNKIDRDEITSKRQAEKIKNSKELQL